ncbi:protein phosphatase CheZ [Marinicellulosiphila megalodicopiae]|uniref:protein phosphatase CheZ n=1 Tax=Marinicellulosiphila megalodicopiae TaxID=2724896 RepID=UPI003BB0B60C
MQANNQENMEPNKATFSQCAADIMASKSEELKLIVEAVDIDQAAKVFQEIQAKRDQSVYQEVGRLTRALHNAIRNFHIDTNPNEPSNNDLSDMVDASDRLSYVVDLTEKAANKTMDLVDECIPMTNHARDELTVLQNDWSRLGEKDMTAEEFRGLYRRVDGFFKSQDASYIELQSNLTNILLAQDFQDLTGQVIQRVTSLVRDVEKSLIDLVKMASDVETVTGFKVSDSETVIKDEQTDPNKGHGPQIRKDESVVNNQDDVDDLLSSLGF